METSGFLSRADLDHACHQLLSKWQDIGTRSDVSLQFRGEFVNPKRATPLSPWCRLQEDEEYLAISRPLHTSSSRASRGWRSEESVPTAELEEIDDRDEAAVHHGSVPAPTVEYHIIYSPSYRVPVLYFFLRNLPSDGPTGIEAVYDYLVPGHQQEALRRVGVMGGVGMTHHPVTDIPCFWVHPCNTAEGMGAMVGGLGHGVGRWEYLMLWIGLVGGAVGLSLPKELAMIK